MLKVEIITPNMPEQKQSRWFCKQLSTQITPRLTECIEQDHLRNYAEKLMCIALDLGKLTDLIIIENKCMVNAKVSAISDSFIIGYFTLFWESESGKVVYPWDQNCGDTLHFGMYISKSEIKRLNFCLPYIYHPVVKSAENQLGFDYQIYYTNDGKLTVYAQDAFSQEELLSIKDTVISFVQKQCCSESPIPFCGDEFLSPKKACFTIDFGSSSQNTIKALISSLSGKANIKKVVFK